MGARRATKSDVIKQRSWREAPASKSGYKHRDGSYASYKHRDGSPKGDQVRYSQCQMQIINRRKLTADSLKHKTNSKKPTVDSQQQIANSRQPTADS